MLLMKKGPEDNSTKEKFNKEQLRRIFEIAQSYERSGRDFEPDAVDQPRLSGKDIIEVKKGRKKPKK